MQIQVKENRRGWVLFVWLISVISLAIRPTLV